jgi:putative heme degradation protein
MRIAKSTRERIAHVKNEASIPKTHLKQLLTRLEEHGGTKAICRQLEDVIARLESWQRQRF